MSLTLEPDGETLLADRALELLPWPTVIIDRKLRVRRANETARQRFDPPDGPKSALDDVLGWSGRVPADARQRILASCETLIAGGLHNPRQDAMIVVAPGHTIALHGRALSDDRWMVVLEDRHGRVDPGAILEEFFRDPITELGNRPHIERKLEETLADDDPDHHPALLVFDVDRFAEINDRLGRQGGDALLRAIAGRLRRATRDADELCRLEGNSFAVLQNNGLGADNLAVRLVDLLGRPYLLRGEVATIGISVGIARAPADGGTAAALLMNADLARQAAKEAGGHTWRRFGQTMAERARSRLELEADLRKAFAASHFTLAYQPKVDLKSGAIAGFEALSRWTCVGRGAVPPGLFIPVAEDIGLIASLGEQILRTACHDAVAWPEPLTVAVNISVRQLETGPAFVSHVLETLRESGLPPRRLELEITEGALLRRPDEIHAVLRDLHDAGVRITLDNFGSGLGSMRQLRGFPFDTVKIDQDFVQTLDSNEASVAIVRAVATLGAGLGLHVIATGVETIGQARLVRAYGCSGIQGFLIYTPVVAAAVPSVLARDIAAVLG